MRRHFFISPKNSRNSYTVSFFQLIRPRPAAIRLNASRTKKIAMINSSIVSDRVRLGIALVRSGHTVSSAAVKASLPEAELGFWHEIDQRGIMPRESDATRRRMN
jgi:hypothetical protein